MAKGTAKKTDGKKRPVFGLSLGMREAMAGYAFLLPWIAGFFLCTLYPFFYSVYLSFQRVSLSTRGILTQWAGLVWYEEALRKSTTFTVALYNTVYSILCSTPIIVVTCLIMAILLNNRFGGRTFFRALFFFPAIVISGPVINEFVTTNAAKIITPEKYVIYQFIKSFGVVGSPLIYVFDNIVTILWFSEVQILIFLAGLQKIGPQLREAASIDGASGWQFFWKVTLPYMKPMILLSTVYTVVELTGFANNPVNVEIQQYMRDTSKVYAYSAAMSWIYFLIVFAIIGFVFFLFRNKEGIDA